MATVKLQVFPQQLKVTCPKCEHRSTLYDPFSCSFFVCSQCNSYINYSENGFHLVHTVAPKPKQPPLIRLGCQADFKGLPYKVIGYMEKVESGTEYYWREYMLYNYTKGYAFLSEYQGQWNFIAGVEQFPELEKVYSDQHGAECNGIEYSLFNKYTPQITGILGEYDWNVLDERIQASEFIAPPYLLVKEQDKRAKSGINWYKGEYIEAREIADAFKISFADFPAKLNVQPNEPSVYYARWKSVSRITPFIVLLVLVVALIFSIDRPSEVIFSEVLPLTTSVRANVDTLKKASGNIDTATGFGVTDSVLNNQTANLPNQYVADADRNIEFKPVKTQSFRVDNATPLEFDIAAEVDNSWTEATIVLVNDKTNETWEVTKGVEYYHGYEDGESWSEGNTTADVLLSGIPKGTYHLNVYPFAGGTSVPNIKITITENVILWRNIIITLLFLCIYPLYCWFRMQSFEKQRWMNSDYSPYDTED
jgi:ribosomal protein S27E